MSNTDTPTKKQLFVQAYWEAVENGVPEKQALELAKVEADYSVNTPISVILRGIEDDLLQHANVELKLTLPKAIKSLKTVLEDPEQKGASNLIAASASVLDRAGVIKKEAKEVNVLMPTGIAFMPPKIPVQIDDELSTSNMDS